MSFYVTLPSNTSFLEYPRNKQTNYTTLIKQPIVLEGSYEVALSDITYSSMFSVELGELKIPNPFAKGIYNSTNRNAILEIKLKDLNSVPTGDFFGRVNQMLEKHVIYEEYKLRYDYSFNMNHKKQELLHFDYEKNSHFLVFKRGNKFEVSFYEKITGETKNVLEKAGGQYDKTNLKYTFDSIDQLKSLTTINLIEIPSDIDQTPQKLRHYYSINTSDVTFNSTFLEIKNSYLDFLNKHQIPYFSYLNNGFLNVIYENDLEISFEGLISVLLTKKHFSEVTHGFSCRFMPTLNVINYAAIYCDLIEDQYIGDTLAPVLRIINLKTSTTPNTIEFFDNPHYVKCRKSIINTVNIQILDLQGNPIEFEDIFSFVIIKLHFRKK